jgi:hypothetical protein
LPPRRHRWNALPERRIPACESIDGNDRTEKPCALCGLVKITVHPARGYPWREWRTKAGKGWVGDATPPCGDTPASAPVLASETTAEVVFS